MSELFDVEKVLEFAGFKLQTVWPSYVDLKKVLKWTYPDGSVHKDLPDFPNDLNACFKWLVPKVLEEYNIESYWFKQYDDWYYSETNIWRKGSTKQNFEVLQDEHIAKDFEQGADLEKITALALCKAIEQLGVKDAGDGEAREQANTADQAEDQQ